MDPFNDTQCQDNAQLHYYQPSWATPNEITQRKCFAICLPVFVYNLLDVPGRPTSSTGFHVGRAPGLSNRFIQRGSQQRKSKYLALPCNLSA